MSPDVSVILPRVLIVSRRSLRKNKFVDFVGEYHLDLVVGYGAVPVIVPRVSGVHMLLDSFEPIHGVLLCEGEDVDPSLYEAETSNLSREELEEIRRIHASDTAIDREKDSIELRLAKLCLERNIPYLGICRGSQVLNVASGGTLYQDIEKEVSKKIHESQRVKHMDYDNYDGHRHVVKVVENTPLHDWFRDSLEEDKMEILVNSYHHQGVNKLAQRFVPMAFAPDGLIEGFYDPDACNPEEGKFIMGLQFHPERMRQDDTDKFDYPGCPRAYQEFVKAVIVYQKKLNSSSTSVPRLLKLDQAMEKKRKNIVRSFFLARNIYTTGQRMNPSKESELQAGAEFLESNTALSLQQENRLKQMGATVRNAGSYIERLRMNEEREDLAKNVMGKMSVEQLSDLLSFYHMMGQICSEVLDRKLNGIVHGIGKKSRNSALEIGEYHLDLVLGYGAVPVIVPRVSGLHMLLDSFEPIHGVLLCEGEDVDPSLYEAETSSLSLEELEEIRRIHASDTAIDREKDSIELAQRFVPMAFAPDGLIEGFYDPDACNPEEGKFIMGLQFHPERMRQDDTDKFDYPGCPRAYQEFVKAVIAYQKKLNSSTASVPRPLKLDQAMEKKRKNIVRSFFLARNIYTTGQRMNPSKESELQAGAEFLESNTALSLQQESRLKQMGATVRNAGSYIERLRMNGEREDLAKNVMGKMSVEQLSDLLSFYHMMGQICSEVLDRKLNGIVHGIGS
ncbi:hypothetical protein NC652_038496 [Populus alba x Populus x berolinensis]|nr:hypothetical protein NC652_038496 [Populus alba x Populus x berolinensis]